MRKSLTEYLSLLAHDWVTLLFGLILSALGIARVNIPAWGWITMACLMFSVVQFRAFHAVRAEVEQLRKPQNWIDKHYAEQGEWPTVPNWLAPVLLKLKSGDRLRKGIKPTIPSLGYYNDLETEQKEMLKGVFEWLEEDFYDALQQAKRLAPPRGYPPLIYK